MTRRVARGELMTVMGLAFAGFVIGMLLAWGMALLTIGFDIVGLHANSARATLFREHPWQTSLAIGSILALFLAGSAAVDLVKQIGWRGMVPNWIWPSTQREETTVAVRLGRVLHWLSVGMASVALIFDAMILIQQSGSVPAAQQEHATWETRHPLGPDGYRLGRDAFGTYGADPEPYIPAVDYSIPIGFAVFAALAALFGRGLRYIIASE